MNLFGLLYKPQQPQIVHDLTKFNSTAGEISVKYVDNDKRIFVTCHKKRAPLVDDVLLINDHKSKTYRSTWIVEMVQEVPNTSSWRCYARYKSVA